jgi:transmembrane sensor
MQHKDLKTILEKIRSGDNTPEEEAMAKYWLHQLNQEGAAGLSDEDLSDARHEMWQAIEAGKQQRTHRIRLWPRIAAAASILLFLSAGLYFYSHRNRPSYTAEFKNDIDPGSNQAILKLAGGQRFIIAAAKTGLLARQGNTTITKTADGQLVYNNTTVNLSNTAGYDTLIVPRGGQHQIKFADGSIAWLNADTKIRFPETFKGAERMVELLSGEAFFKIVHNEAAPFKVKVNGQITQDIGTEFNISAYPDEPQIKTTLVEGSIKITKNNQSAILKPGQQAQVNFSGKDEKIKLVEEVDLDKVIAWKEGMFRFDKTPLETIMKQVSRWYDVDVVYQDESLKEKTFFAVSTRFGKVSQLLHHLEQTSDVRFKIEGKKITVLDK